MKDFILILFLLFDVRPVVHRYERRGTMRFKTEKSETLRRNRQLWVS